MIVNTLEEHKGEDILVLDISKIADFADYFILCSGTSDRMLNSLADALTETLKKNKVQVAKREGQPAEGWIIVDAGDVIIHLFSPEKREFYQIEQLWAQGKTLVHFR